MEKKGGTDFVPSKLRFSSNVVELVEPKLKIFNYRVVVVVLRVLVKSGKRYG